MSCAGNLDRFLCRKRVLTQHIGFSYALHRFSYAACAGKWVLTPPLRSQTSQTFCESAGNMLTRRALYNDRASRVTTCRSMRSFPQWHGLKQARFHQGRAKPHGAATSQTSFGHTVCHRLDTTVHHQASWTPPRVQECWFSGQCWQKALNHVGYYSLTRMRLTLPTRSLRAPYAERAVTLLDLCEVPVSSKHSRPPQQNLFSHQMQTSRYKKAYAAQKAYTTLRSAVLSLRPELL